MSSCRFGRLLPALSLVLCACGSSLPVESVGSKVAADHASLSCDGYPRDNSSGSITLCEAREFTGLPSSGAVALHESYAPASQDGSAGVSFDPYGVDDAPQSTLKVTGADGDRIDLRAYVYATAGSEEEARGVLAAVEIHIDGNDYYATGPDRNDISTNAQSERNWAVSFDVTLPRATDVTASSEFGPVLARNLGGVLDISSTYGDVDLADLAGADVTGRSDFGTLTVADADGSIKLSSTNGVIVTQRLSGAIEINADTGMVTAAGLDGDSHISSGNGDVQVSAVRGTFVAEISTGALQAEDVDADFSFNNNNGAVSLKGMAGHLSGETASGNIDIELAGPSWSGEGAQLASQAGSITLHAPADYSGTFDFTTSSGTLRSEFSGNSATGQAHFNETTGQGGPLIQAQTQSGDISLLKQ